MCGVFAFVCQENQPTSPELVLAGLKQLEYRGYDSWGVAVAAAAQILVKKKVGKIGSATVKELPKSSVAIGHTRWATHGGVTEANAHPHLDCLGKIAVVHNGIVENFPELKAELIAKGHRFSSETDTEVIVHLLEVLCQDHPFEQAFQLTFQRLQGLNAVVAIHADEEVVLAAKKGSPLVIGFGQGQNFLASDPAALLSHTKQVYFLEDDQLVILKPDQVKVINALTSHPVKYQVQTLNWEITQAERGDFPHFMLKEIYEQPNIVAKLALQPAESIYKLAKTMKQAQRRYVIGCGTAAYAALAGTYLFAKIAECEAQAVMGSEFSYHLPFVGATSCVLALSQSGETIDILEPLKVAQHQQAQVLAVVNVMGSSLERMAEAKLLLQAGPEKAVASTKALTAKLAQLLLIAQAMVQQLEPGQLQLQQASLAMQAVLAPGSIAQIHSLANSLKSAEHLYIIGRGLSFPIALEAALKIKEVTYLHAEGLAGGELKHGALALINTGTPCLVLAPNDETYHDSISSAREVKARGGYILGISHQPHEVFDAYLPITDVGLVSFFPILVTVQILAYYLAIARQLDPDMPRNLAKSVTVK